MTAGRLILRTVCVLSLGALAACSAKKLPMSAPTPVDAMPISASFGRTWDEVMDFIVESNFSARVLDRASGFFQSLPVRYLSSGIIPPPPDARFRGTAPRRPAPTTRAERMATMLPPREADCGGDDMNGRYLITDMRLDIHVWGDSSGARVRVSPLFFSDEKLCNTRGSLEKDIIDRVKERAERTAPVAAVLAPAPSPAASLGRAPSAPTTQPPLVGDSAWVGSRVDQVFYRRDCVAAQEVGANNRRYFRSEQEALAAGYRRSRIPGC